MLRATTALTISTSQLPKVVRTRHCFSAFDLDMCFTPQQRVLFQHLNFQKRSEREVALAFSLGNVLCATTACNCSSLIWPDGSAPAALANLLFEPPEPQILEKHSESRLSHLFVHVRLLSSHSFSSELLSSSLLLSDFSHLCFSICSYCRKFDF